MSTSPTSVSRGEPSKVSRGEPSKTASGKKHDGEKSEAFSDKDSGNGKKALSDARKGRKHDTEKNTAADESKKAVKRKKSITPPGFSTLSRLSAKTRAVAAAGTMVVAAVAANRLTSSGENREASRSNTSEDLNRIPSPLSGLNIGEFLDSGESDDGENEECDTSVKNDARTGKKPNKKDSKAKNE